MMACNTVAMDDLSFYEEVDNFPSTSRMEQKQRKAIEELVTSEKRYLTLLQLCATDIRDHLQSKQVPDLDLEGLFGNIDDVIPVSSNLLKHLEETATGKSDQLLLISNVFLTFKQELEDAYKVYCVNYDNILQLESMYKKNEHIWKEVLETLTAVRSDTGAMELTFYLVMPVQRILKYQLLLETILKNTPQSDEGYAALEKAIRAMQEVNININEYKGQQEVASKYIKAENLSIKDSICRINTHSIVKKACRLSQVIKHEAGILPKTKDKDYDDLVTLFNIMRKDVTTLKKNTGTYITNVEHFQYLNPYQDFPDLVDENDAACYRPFIEKLYEQVIPEFFPSSHKVNFWQQTEETLQKSNVKLEEFCQIFESILEHIIEQPVNQEKLDSLLKKYSPSKIYLVTSNISGNKDLDLTLQRGDLVAVLQSTDTKGKTNRWLVDSGGQRGFVPAGKLSLYQSKNEPGGNKELLGSSLVDVGDGTNSRRSSCHLPVVPPPSIQYQVIAAYHFAARGPQEANLQPGDAVTILEAHDKRGNTEWYLIEVNGQRGYVPSNYLVKVPVTGVRKSFAL
ncbi:rho guanine nucleotide exchange factor 37 isoform X4 [Mobula hypostoma]|uniref:rho guanine nucleotide exchange factor 37 isoform X4 n=1 Tax=Mobula hypostoma TaxID=723540 RepID=UPI002FC32AB6